MMDRRAVLLPERHAASSMSFRAGCAQVSPQSGWKNIGIGSIEIGRRLYLPECAGLMRRRASGKGRWFDAIAIVPSRQPAWRRLSDATMIFGPGFASSD
jgi:hypothetical protein